MPNPFTRPQFRAAVYTLGALLLVILGLYDLVNAEQAAAWTQFLGAALAVLALLNVPKDTDDGTD